MSRRRNFFAQEPIEPPPNDVAIRFDLFCRDTGTAIFTGYQPHAQEYVVHDSWNVYAHNAAFLRFVQESDCMYRLKPLLEPLTLPSGETVYQWLSTCEPEIVVWDAREQTGVPPGQVVLLYLSSDGYYRAGDPEEDTTNKIYPVSDVLF